ncbi:MAG: DUF3313 domain-containing protein [Gammaproteobacteria bacterium]|nr:DUF3313 domain-containing protein [Gammaproteobacteria bacterium]
MTLSKFGYALVAASLMSLGACAGVVQIDDLETAGFLTDEVYAKLEPTNDSVRAGLGYINKDMDISRHDKILLDPVVSFVGEDSDDAIDAEDAQTLVNNFHALLASELSKDYELVAAPGPNTLRFQVAIVRATKSSVALDTISTIVPVGVVATKLASYVTGKPSFTGQLKIEFEVRDADTRELFGAGIDSRAGGKVLNEDQLNGWADVNKIMKLYAQIMRYQLCLARGDTDCEKPVA